MASPYNNRGRTQGNERSCCDLWKVPFAVVLVFLLVFTLTNLASIKAREEQMSKGGKYLKVEIEERVQWRRNVNIGEQSKKEDEAKMIKKSTRGSERKEQDEALGASRLETNVRRGRRKESSGRRKLRESEKSTNTATPATLSENCSSWIATIHLAGEENFFCGGTLVSSQWVLTAAHCLFPVTPRSHQVSLFIPDTEERHIFNVKEVIIHQNYNPETSANDIGMLKLDSPARGQECLPKSTDNPPQTGQICRTTVSGATESGGRTTEAFNHTSVPLVDPTNCFDTVGPLEGQPGEYLCAGMVDDENRVRGLCARDEGVPLVCESQGRCYLEGIASVTSQCSLTAYTSVRSHLAWIKQNISHK